MYSWYYINLNSSQNTSLPFSESRMDLNVLTYLSKPNYIPLQGGFAVGLPMGNNWCLINHTSKELPQTFEYFLTKLLIIDCWTTSLWQLWCIICLH